MKTAISIPDELFRRAERASADRRISRSSLFALAIEAYLDGEGADDPLAASWDAVAGEPEARLDPALRRHQEATLGRTEW